MKLSEKIMLLRKRNGYSQEELSEKFDVSRQSISKWETGDSTPEVTKLPLIAKLFDVSVDWLLSEDDFSALEQEPQQKSQFRSYDGSNRSSNIEQIPGVVDRLAGKYSWLVGVYIFVGGFFMFLFGLIANSMGNSFIEGTSGFMIPGETFSPFQQHHPFSGISSIFTVLGAIIMCVGGFLAFYLKNKNESK